MNLDDVVDQLVEALDSQQAAQAAVSQLNPDDLLAVAQALKRQVLTDLQRDAPKALALTTLILDIADWRGLPLVYALGLQTKAIALTLLKREYEAALALFTESETIFRQHDDVLSVAVGQVTKVWALACLQRFEEAYAAGQWAGTILEAHDQHRTLAALNNNLAAIYGRRGQDSEALNRIVQVEAAYGRLGEEGLRRLPLAQINRAIVLRNLGRFDESIAVNQQALANAEKLAQTANIARSKQILGITFFALGRFNEALTRLHEARDIFLSDKRYRDAILVELFISDGYLHLRRYETVLEKCRQVQTTFQEVGTQFEVAQAMLNEATALAGLHEFEAAQQVLDQTRVIFVAEDNISWQLYTDLEKALLLYRQKQYTACRSLVLQTLPALESLHLTWKQGQAYTIVAQAALALGHIEEAETYLAQALAICRDKDIPALTYHCHYLRGNILLAQGASQKALTAFETAIQELERLQGQIMVEFRADFLADKEAVYASAVDLCLAVGNPEIALNYAERAKSRALLSLLSHHLNLRIEAHSPQDEPLVTTLLALCEKRNRLYRRWETGEEAGSVFNQEADQAATQQARGAARQTIIRTEDEIRKLWHRLLVRNSAYAPAAALWQVQTNVNKGDLDEDTLLIEYFSTGAGFVVFLISCTTVTAHTLSVAPETIPQLWQRLQHNFNILQQAPQLAKTLTGKAQRLLHTFFQILVAPFASELAPYKRLVIVPHGFLHYLPFHAFYDGQNYLLDHHQVSYLPGSSFSHMLHTPPQKTGAPALILGHDRQGKLLTVHDEAQTVAECFDGNVYLNQAATRAVFQEKAGRAPLIHMATHGDFRPQNPLFSGLQLADGLLTTLDVFNQPLSASLVTLSACRTGRTIIGGGDELFGLMRAFLVAGSASLLLTLWPVEDATTTQLMRCFYEGLAAGQSKIAALQAAQKNQLAANGRQPHPYYWAPFFLVGHTGPLS